MGKYNLTRMTDLSLEDVEEIYRISAETKDDVKNEREHHLLRGKLLAMYFEKPSLRTRCTFEAGMFDLGGHAIQLEGNTVGIGRRESVYDVAKNLERWFDLIMIRTYQQRIVEELAQHANIPVINALTDDYHPCQALADLFTVREHMGALKGLTLTFMGDGNNICASLAQLCPMLGVNFRHCGPSQFQLKPHIFTAAQKLAQASGATVEYTDDPAAAVKGANMIYTDVWASMGQEAEAEQRKTIFMPYQVNTALMAQAEADALIMHDLPAHRGEEITDDVIDSPRSIVFDQAENRLHVQKGIMVHLFFKNKKA
ncbi:ornithine carbamoyltransferase [Candidatus Sumerlaeota bacterium]|nr:ornithine carbamoyltransferase [Candidatus Sumerlaeota bacterium]